MKNKTYTGTKDIKDIKDTKHAWDQGRGTQKKEAYKAPERDTGSKERISGFGKDVKKHQ